MMRSRIETDKITEYHDWQDGVSYSLKVLRERLEDTERKLETVTKRLGKAESIINLIYYESNPAYLTGLKVKYKEEYGEKDEQKQAK